MSGLFRPGIDVAWAFSVFRQLCGGSSTLTVEPLARAIRDIMQTDDMDSPHVLAVQLLNTMDADQNGMVTFDEFLGISESNPELFDQLMGVGAQAQAQAPPSTSEAQRVLSGTEYLESSTYATGNDPESRITQLKDVVSNLERELNQCKHEKDLLEATMRTQLADTEGDVSDLMRGVQEKDDMIRTLKDENAKLKSECSQVHEMQSVNLALEARIARLQSQLAEFQSAEHENSLKKASAGSAQLFKLESELQSLRTHAEQRELELLTELRSKEVQLQLAVANSKTREDAFILLQQEMRRMREKASESEFLRQQNKELKDLLDEQASKSFFATVPSLEEVQVSTRQRATSTSDEPRPPQSPATPLRAMVASMAGMPSLAENLGYDTLHTEIQELKEAHARETGKLKFDVEVMEMKLIALQKQLGEQVAYATDLEQEYRSLKLQSAALGTALDKAKSVIDNRTIFQKFSLFGRSAPAAPPPLSPRQERRQIAPRETPTNSTSITITTAATAKPEQKRISPSATTTDLRHHNSDGSVATSVSAPSLRPSDNQQDGKLTSQEASPRSVTPVSIASANAPSDSGVDAAQQKRDDAASTERKQVLTGLSGLLSRFSRKSASDVLKPVTSQASGNGTAPVEIATPTTSSDADTSDGTEPVARLAEAQM